MSTHSAQPGQTTRFLSLTVLPRRPAAHRAALTLFEVALSLLLVTISVVSVLILFPAGIKAQQLSRYQILASTRAMEMIDTFASSSNANIMIDREGPNPWDSIASYRSSSPDLEARIATHRFGMMPLPPDIARRLDSDGDEIRTLLAQGGYLYYSQPLATASFNPIGARANQPLANESQKLLCAITGYAQQNAVPGLPNKDWPYYTPYPSPPVHGWNDCWADSKPGTPWSFYESSAKTMLWEDTLDADQGHMGVVFEAIVKGQDLPLTTLWVDNALVKSRNLRRSSGYWAYGDQGGWIPDFSSGKWLQRNPDGGKRNNVPDKPNPGNRYDIQPATLPDLLGVGVANPVYLSPTTGQPTTMKELSREAALAYFALAKWYAAKKGVSTAIREGQALADDANLLKTSTLFAGIPANPKPALAVNAARLLAHAAMCVTNHFIPDNATDEQIVVATELDVIREGTNGFGEKAPAFTLNRQTIQNYHDNCLKLVMRYAASHPYDWGSPRPLNRAIMMDFPLIQYDPFAGFITPDTTTFAGYNYGKPAQQWKLLSAQPITNIGRSFSFPSQPLATMWPTGELAPVPAKHFTLTRQFKAADRCRQIVFWAVDWQSYEDFETAPSAPVDASRYPTSAPNRTQSAVANLMGAEFADRHQFNVRNPEKTLLFLSDMSGRPTGDETVQIMGPDNTNPAGAGQGNTADKGVAGKLIFSGRYGADRNCNGTRTETDASGRIVKMFGKLDRGSLPSSVRLRAITVARFNYYDPRLPLVAR